MCIVFIQLIAELNKQSKIQESASTSGVHWKAYTNPKLYSVIPKSAVGWIRFT